MVFHWQKTSWLLLSVVLFGFLFAVVTGCSDSPSGPKQLEKQVNPVDTSRTTIASAAVYDDDSGEKLGTGQTTIERSEGTTLSIRVEAEGYVSQKTTLDFDGQGQYEEKVTLQAENPDSVTATYEITDKDDQVVEDARLFIADTLANNTPSGTLTLPYSEAVVNFCGRAENYENSCQSTTLDSDRDIAINISKKTKVLTVTPEILNEEALSRSAGSTIDEYTNYSVTIDGDTFENTGPDGTEIKEGEPLTVELPYAKESVDISSRIVYYPERGHEYSENNYPNVGEGAQTVSLSSDSTSVTHELDRLPACSDNFDNDGSRGTDLDDPGCTEPEDDVELLRVGVRTSGSTASDETYFVSGVDGKREIKYAGSYASDFPKSVKAALEIKLEQEVLVSETQTGESFAVRLETGKDDQSLNTVNTTDITTDKGRDGWVLVEVPGITPDFFKNGGAWRSYMVHASKAKNEAPTNGDDDVIFLKAGDNTTRRTIFTWIYPPEDVESSNQKPGAVMRKSSATSGNTDTKIYDAGEASTDIGIQ